VAGLAAVEASARRGTAAALRAFAGHVALLAALEARAGRGAAAVTTAEAAAATTAALTGLGAFAGHVSFLAAVEARAAAAGAGGLGRAFARHVAGLAAVEAGLGSFRHFFVGWLLRFKIFLFSNETGFVMLKFFLFVPLDELIKFLICEKRR
jgi:hypothetical protein